MVILLIMVLICGILMGHAAADGDRIWFMVFTVLGFCAVLLANSFYIVYSDPLSIKERAIEKLHNAQREYKEAEERTIIYKNI